MQVMYDNGEYKVIYCHNMKKRRFMAVNKKDIKKHTHRYSCKECIDICNFAKHESLPRGSSADFLLSLYRILPLGKFRDKVERLMNTKANKLKGNQKYYINVQKGGRK